MATRTTIKTFELEKGKVFVAGLLWSPLTSRASSSAHKIEIQKIAKEQSLDLMVMRTTGAPQVGLGASIPGMSPAAYSAAAMISKGLEVEGMSRNALCALQISNDKWYYFAQREGVILAVSDRIGDEDEIRSKLLDQISITEWETVIAPDHWSLDNSVQRTFESFIPKRRNGKYDYKKWWLIHPVQRKFVNTKLLGVTAAVAALAVGGIYAYARYKAYLDDKQVQEVIAQVNAHNLMHPKVVPKPVHPWKNVPSPAAFSENCEVGLGTLKSLTPANWTLRDFTCEATAAVVVWTRPPNGTLSGLLKVEPSAVISEDGNMATLNIVLKPTAGTDEVLDSQVKRLNELNDTAQKLGLALSFTKPVVKAILPGEKANDAESAQDWRAKEFSITSSLDPKSIVAALDGKGFRITQIITTLDAGIMNRNIQGTQYVQP